MRFSLSSPAFEPHEPLPVRLTCDGEGVSPPLEWQGVPAGTRSLALIVDDPDAPDPRDPKTTWVHWVLYNIPTTAEGLPEGAARHGLPVGARHGRNDWKGLDYGGPCPPVGTHRYFHKLYALDVVLPDLHGPTRTELERAMHGHVLARAELVGTYRKQAGVAGGG